MECEKKKIMKMREANGSFIKSSHASHLHSHSLEGFRDFSLSLSLSDLIVRFFSTGKGGEYRSPPGASLVK